jgi:L-asparaginase
MPISVVGRSDARKLLIDSTLVRSGHKARTPRTLQWEGPEPRFGRPAFISVMNTIRILVTGGTFDKEYDELTGRLFFRDTHVPEMLRRGRCRLDVTIETVMMVDSLELDDTGRAGIVQRARDSEESAIVVTHGTDTMVQTARALADARLDGKTVVLTGAMVPYAFGSSDGLFNLGSALSFVQVLPPGVYIAMNGQHFLWNAVRKNTTTGCFELA